jgi:hypothetical protein
VLLSGAQSSQKRCERDRHDRYHVSKDDHVANRTFRFALAPGPTVDPMPAQGWPRSGFHWLFQEAKCVS